MKLVLIAFCLGFFTLGAFAEDATEPQGAPAPQFDQGLNAATENTPRREINRKRKHGKRHKKRHKKH